MSDSATVFDQYSLTSKSEAAQPQENRPTYQAVGLDKTRNRQAWMAIHYPDRTIDLFPYAQLTQVSYLDPQHLLLVFRFNNCILSLEGRELDQLLEPLQDEKVRAFICFQPDIYAPLESGVPVITYIERQDIHALAGA